MLEICSPASCRLATYPATISAGNGMPAIRWRSRKGEDTNAFDLPFDGPPGAVTLRLVRSGVKMFLFMAKEGAPLKEIVHTEVSFQGPVLVGLTACSHDA